MKLLRKTHMSIQKITERVGYRSQGKFSIAFKDVAQMLPTEYRNQFLTIDCLAPSIGLMEAREPVS